MSILVDSNSSFEKKYFERVAEILGENRKIK